MKTPLVNIKRLIKLTAESLYAYTCCPQCGAPLGGRERCEYCGSPAPKHALDRIIGVLLRLYSQQILEEKIDDLGIKIDDLKTLVIKETENLRHLFNRMTIEGIKGDELKSYVLIAVKQGEIPDEIKKVAPDLLGRLEDIGPKLKKYSLYYRAKRHREAMKFYIEALTTIISPESGEIPAAGIALPLPNGLFDVSRADINKDGREETVFIPSKEIGALNMLGSILEKSGEDISKVLGIDANPRIAQIIIAEGINGFYYAIWENANLMDMKIKFNGRTKYFAGKFMTVANFMSRESDNIILATTRGIVITDGDQEERVFLGDINDLHALDYDDDGLDELLVISAKRNLFFLDYNEEGISVKRIGEVSGSEMLASMYFINREVGFMLGEDGIYQIDDTPVLIYQTTPGENPLGISKIRIKNQEYLAYLYLSGGELRMKLFGEKIEDGLSIVEEITDIPIHLITPEKFKILELEKTDRIPDYPKYSRWFLKAYDVDKDYVDELFLGTKKALLSIDLKFNA